MNEYQNLWNQVLDKLAANLSTSTFEQTFGETKKIAKYEDGVIYIVVPDQFTKHRINSMHYRNICDILAGITTKKIKIQFVLENEIKPVQKEPFTKLSINNLNPNYTFESFVVGESNKMSYLTALKVAETPGKLYNPLYIFGGVGLGKTHLMQAIGNYIGLINVDAKILYVQANDYINDYGKASRDNNMKPFEEKYGNIDVLLVDDIQMLTGKNGTQQQFFNLFNDMTNNQKQIVITSDKPADKLNGFMDRLTSRFQMGVMVNINQPDLQQRVEILKRKAEELTQEKVDIEILEYIADNFTSNVRELEGALNRVLLYAELINSNALTLAVAKDALDVLIQSKKPTVSNDYENALSVIADMYKITVSDLLGSNRSAKFVTPRHIAMFILKDKYKLNYSKIGAILNGRDHTTIMNGCKKIEAEIETNNELKMAIEAVMKKV